MTTRSGQIRRERWTGRPPIGYQQGHKGGRLSTNTQEQDGGRDGGPFLLAKVLADTLVTTIGRPRREGARAGAPDASGDGSGDGAGAARPATCRDCGEAAYWHRTVRGKWILMEPGPRPVHTVPAGQRWRVAADGTAVNLGSASPTDTCRISHFSVCPGRGA